jgi:hypothetical protein
MTAITVDQPLRVAPGTTPVLHKFVMNTSVAQAWYKGEALIIDQDVDTVYVTPVHDITHPVVASTDVFLGIAAEGGTIAISAAENLEKAGVEAYVYPTVLGFKNNTTLTNASCGLGIYLSEGNQLVLVASVADIPYIGILSFVEDGYAYVELHTNICSGA